MAALAFLLALTAGFYWRLTISGRYTWLESPDMAFQVRPWLDFQAREFQAGRLPLWTPYEWGGQSLAGQAQPGLTNPLNWILFAMPLRDGHIPLGVLHWYWLLIHWVGAAFCFALCRDLKAGVPASLLGGSIFALTGFVGHTDWPQILMTAVWMPLVLLFFARVFRGERPRSNAALAGAAMGMAFLAGHHQIPIAASVLMAALWLWYLAWRGRRVEPWISAAIFTSAWVLVAAVQWLPSLEYGRHAVRWAGALEPLRWNDPVPYRVHEEYSFSWTVFRGLVDRTLSFYVNPFVGYLAAGLAASSLILLRRIEVRLFAAVALGGLVLALGANTPVYQWLYSYYPMFEKARTPAFSIVLAQLGIAVLAAMALERWTRRVPRAAWLALPLFIAEASLAAPHHGLLDRPGAYWKTMRDQADIAAFLKSRPGWFRVQVNDEEVPYNFGDFFAVEQFGGYVPSMQENVFRALGRAGTPRLFGIRYRVARTPLNPGEREVFSSRSGLKVFENAEIAEPLSLINDAGCDSPGRVRVISRVSGSMTVEAEAGCPAQLITGDSYFKGWRATVDGRRTPISEFAGVARSVRVPAGRHTVEYRYRPATVYWGALMTLFGLISTAYFFVSGRRAVCVNTKH